MSLTVQQREIIRTRPGFKSPVLAQADGLPESAWGRTGRAGAPQAAGMGRAPVRRGARARRGAQGQLFPIRAVILVSRDDLPLAELVRRCGKRGRENAFKGPLRDLDLHHPPAGQLALPRLRPTGADTAAHRAVQPAARFAASEPRQVLLAQPKGKHGENRQPIKVELETRYRLDQRNLQYNYSLYNSQNSIANCC